MLEAKLRTEMMLSELKKGLVPQSLSRMIVELKLFLQGKKDSRTVRKIFSKIYRKNRWGGKSGDLYSGEGSHNNLFVKPYVNLIVGFLKKQDYRKLRLVDLGCGDFNVGANFIGYCSEYIGVDVVPAVIQKLKANKYQEHVKFLCLDIINGELPDGDICFLRQVLQHLSNRQIVKILPKLKKYRIVFITEHYPLDNNKIIPNKEITPGSNVREDINSAVYLNRPPFNIPDKNLQLVLEARHPKYILRTYKLEF